MTKDPQKLQHENSYPKILENTCSIVCVNRFHFTLLGAFEFEVLHHPMQEALEIATLRSSPKLHV